MPYLLDADVFIRAKNLHYGFDFCPAFWAWLLAAHMEGAVFSIEKVFDDLHGVADELSLWAAAAPPAFFRSPDASVLPSLGVVSTWATSKGYDPAAISTFLQVSDYYLVAQAHAYSFTVVTHEIPSASVRRIKIPDACLGIGIKVMTPYEMLRRERARFVLGS
jgi:hypothetical protein